MEKVTRLAQGQYQANEGSISNRPEGAAREGGRRGRGEKSH